MGEQSLPSSYSASPLARLLNYVFSSGDSIAQAGDMSDSDSTSNNDAGSRRSSEHETPKAKVSKPKSGTVVTTAAGGTSAGAVMASNRASWEYSSSEESSGSSGFQAPRPNQTSHSSLLTTKIAEADRGGKADSASPTSPTSSFSSSTGLTTSSSKAGAGERSGSEGGTAALRRSFAEQLLEKPNRLPRGCRPICAAVLSYWDNICGPKIEKVLLPCIKLLSGLRPLALSLFVKIDPNPTRSQ